MRIHWEVIDTDLVIDYIVNDIPYKHSKKYATFSEAKQAFDNFVPIDFLIENHPNEMWWENSPSQLPMPKTGVWNVVQRLDFLDIEEYKIIAEFNYRWQARIYKWWYYDLGAEAAWKMTHSWTIEERCF